MGSDEEKLDDLLKSIMENEGEFEHLDSDGEVSEDIAAAADDMGLNDLDFAIEDFGEEEPISEDELESELEDEASEKDEGSSLIDDLAIQDFGEEEPEPEDSEEISEVQPEMMEAEDEGDLSLNDFAIQEPDIDDINMEDIPMEADTEESMGVLSADEVEAMLAAATAAANGETEGQDDSMLDIAASDSVLSDDEVPEEAFAGVSDEASEDADVAEISGLLQQDSGESVDDDMLALLESMSAEIEENENASETEKKEAEIKEQEEKTEKAEKKKKSFSGIFAGKKKKEKESIEEEEADEFSEAVDIDVLDAEMGGNPVSAKKSVSKNEGFFAKMISFLTESDEEESEAEHLKEEHGMEPSNENRTILKELDAEDKKKKKKKLKGKNAEKDNAADDEDDEMAADSSKKKKKKKKKEAPAEPLEPSKPEKRVSKKNIAIITGLCLTLTALVVVLCSVIPGFFDKREARDAFYASDYAKSYELLYGKKLDNSDTIIYNKSRIIMSMNRRLTAYHNYLGIGKEVQALDSLLTAITKYPEILAEAEEYHVEKEVNSIYETILSILSDKYHLSEPVAKVIIGYEDDLTYTKKLESIVYHTPFVMPGEDEEETTSVADVLPEEQSLVEVPQTESADAAEGQDAEEELPVEELPVASDSENNGNELAAADNTDSEPAVEEELPQQEPEQAETVQEAPAQEEGVSAIPPENRTSSSGSQGQLIQGVKQPIAFEINQN